MLGSQCPQQTNAAPCLRAPGNRSIHSQLVSRLVCSRLHKSTQRCGHTSAPNSLCRKPLRSQLYRQLNPLVCHAAQPQKQGPEADIPSSSRDTASTPEAGSLQDTARKASNATASTSGSSTKAETGKSFSRIPLLGALQQSISAFLTSIRKFFGRFPAFIQREKLQRLHKKALDDPSDADRY